MDIPQMNIRYGQNQNEAIVMGFEAPQSPDASYSNVFPEDDKKEAPPPTVPRHLELDHTLLNSSAGRDLAGSLPLPQNAILNHFYCENRKTEPVVAVGLTHRFREKYVTVVLYKPVHGNGSTST